MGRAAARSAATRAARARARPRVPSSPPVALTALPRTPQVTSLYWSNLPACFVVVAFFALLGVRWVVMIELEAPRTAKLIP